MADILSSINSSKKRAKNSSANKQKASQTKRNIENKVTSKMSKGQKYYYAGNRVKNAMSQQQYFNQNPNPKYATNDKLKFSKDRLFTGGLGHWRVGYDEKDANGNKTGNFIKYNADEFKNRNKVKNVYSKGNNFTSKSGRTTKNVKLLSDNEMQEWMNKYSKGYYPGTNKTEPIHEFNTTGKTGVKDFTSPLKEGIKQAKKTDSLMGKIGAIGSGLGASAFNGVMEVADVLNTLNYGAHGFASGFVGEFNNDGKLNKGELKNAWNKGLERGKIGINAGLTDDNGQDDEGRYGWYDTFKAFSDNKQERLNREGIYLSETEEKKRDAKLQALGLGFDIGGAILTANAGTIATKGGKLIQSGSKLSGNALKGLSKVAKVADLGIDLPIADLVRGTGKSFSKFNKVATNSDDVAKALNSQLDNLGVGVKSQAIGEHIINKAVRKTDKAKGIRQVSNGVKIGGFEIMKPETVQKIADSNLNVGGMALNTAIDSVMKKKRISGVSGAVTDEVLKNTIAKALKKGYISPEYVENINPGVLEKVAMTVDDTIKRRSGNITSQIKNNNGRTISKEYLGNSKVNSTLDLLQKGSADGFTQKELAKANEELINNKTLNRTKTLKGGNVNIGGEDINMQGALRQRLQLLGEQNGIDITKAYTKPMEELTEKELQILSQDPNWVKRQMDFAYNVRRDEGTLDMIYRNTIGDEIKNASTTEKWSDVVARKKAEKEAKRLEYRKAKDVKPREYDNIMSKKDNELLNYLDNLPDDVQDEFYDYISKKDPDLYEALVMESNDIDAVNGKYSILNDSYSKDYQNKIKANNDAQLKAMEGRQQSIEKSYTKSDKKVPYKSRQTTYTNGIKDVLGTDKIGTLSSDVSKSLSKDKLPRKERLEVIKRINDELFDGKQVFHDEVGKKDLKRFIEALNEQNDKYGDTIRLFGDEQGKKRALYDLLEDKRLSHIAYTDPNYYKKLSQRTKDVGSEKTPILNELNELRNKANKTPLDRVKERELEKKLKPFDEWWDKYGHLDEDEWEKAFTSKKKTGYEEAVEEYANKNITKKDIDNYRQDLYDSLTDEDIIPYDKFLESKIEENPNILFDKNAKKAVDIEYKQEVKKAKKGVIDSMINDEFGESVIKELSYKNKEKNMILEQKRNQEVGSARSLQSLQNGVGEILEGTGNKVGKNISNSDVAKKFRKNLELPEPISAKIKLVGNQKHKDIPAVQSNLKGLRQSLEKEYKLRLENPDSYESNRKIFKQINVEYVKALRNNGVADEKYFSKVTALQDKLNKSFEELQSLKQSPTKAINIKNEQKIRMNIQLLAREIDDTLVEMENSVLVPISKNAKNSANNLILTDLTNIGYTTDEANKIIEQGSDVIKKALKGEEVNITPSKAPVKSSNTILDKLIEEKPKTSKNGVQSVKKVSSEDKIADFIQKHDDKPYNSKLGQNPLVKLYDGIAKDFKAGTTGLNPGWNVMNTIQNKMNGYYGIGSDVFNKGLRKDSKAVVDSIEGKRKWLGKEIGKDVPTNAELSNKIIGKNKDGSDITLEDVKDIIDLEGLVNDTFFKTETKNGKKNIFNDVLRPSGEHSMWSLGGLHNNVRTEAYDKAQQVLGSVKQGKSITEGIENANKYLFDYDDITKAEKEYAKRIMPFYTYYRKNGALQLDRLANTPRKMATYLDTRNQFEKGIDTEDKQRRDEWTKDKLQIPNTTMVNPKDNTQAFYNMMLNTSTPWDGLMQLPSLTEDANINNMPSANPILESLYQKYVTNEDYFGNKLDDKNILELLKENLVKPSMGTVGKLSDVKDQPIKNNEKLKLLEILTGIKAKYHKSWQDWGFEDDGNYVPPVDKKELVRKYKDR